MAESQLMCMEDGHINEKVPDVKPEFYYSEEQRSALEELLKNGDGAFKTRLREDRVTDFLSAREIKTIRNTFRNYETDEHDEDASQAAGARKAHRQDSTSLRSTYWPQMSDTEVPPLDIGWPSGGFFKGVTRVSVHTHPPKDNGPHIKEVVRRLIQGAGKVIAIVMDLLTDVQILRDLLDAASKRGVPVYIVLDIQGMPHFLDMCNRLCVTSQHLVNIRVRTVRGVGFDMSFGRIPGSLCSKYMLIDGDKVAFGTYSYSWTTSRMDRNMITVLSGQIVDTFDRDFRELYAISDNLNLFKEFNVSRPRTETLTRVTVPKRPTLSTTARFQVSLGERGELKVPAHKYYNPKYLLALGEIDPAATSKNFIDKMEPEAAPVEMAEDRMLTQRGSEEPNELSPLPDQTLDKSRKNMRRFEIKPRILKKTKVKKTEGSNKQCRSPAPSTAATPALTSHMAEPTQGLERGESTPGGGEKPNEPNTSTDLMQNKSSKRFRLFKKKSATPINKMAASNEDTLEVDEQGSSAPCTIGNSVPTNVSAKLTQDFPPTIESTPAKTNAKGPGHQTMNSQEDQGAEDQVHKKKTCILS